MLGQHFVTTLDYFDASSNDLNRGQSGGGMVCRHFDTTPIYVKFGALQSTVCQQARYLKEVQRVDPFTGASYPCWTTISFTQEK